MLPWKPQQWGWWGALVGRCSKGRGHLGNQQFSEQGFFAFGLLFLFLYLVIEPGRLGCSPGKRGKDQTNTGLVTLAGELTSGLPRSWVAKGKRMDPPYLGKAGGATETLMMDARASKAGKCQSWGKGAKKACIFSFGSFYSFFVGGPGI